MVLVLADVEPSAPVEFASPWPFSSLRFTPMCTQFAGKRPGPSERWRTPVMRLVTP